MNILLQSIKTIPLWFALLSSPALGFKASVVKVDITPEESKWLVGYAGRQYPSDGVHDPIFHRIVAMEQDGTRFILVSSDLGGYSPSFYLQFCRDLEEATGIGPSQLWWTVTHTHSGPMVGPVTLKRSVGGKGYEGKLDAEYPEKVKNLLIRGIEEAVGKLEPALLAVGKGMSLANMNRRALTLEGKTVLGLNPYGPVDREIGLIRLERPDGSLIVLIANYAMHGTHLSGRNRKISGDAQGIVAAYVEEKVGAPMLYVNGAAGNISPIYNFHENFRVITQFNVLLGDPILEANQSIQVDPTADTGLWLGETVIETPLKEGLPWPEDLPDYHRVTSSGTELIRVPVQFLRIGRNTVIWSAPLELFCELAINIREQSPFANTFYFGYSNGWLGYMPTKQAFSEGGYEISACPYTEQVERDFTQGVIQYLHTMRR